MNFEEEMDKETLKRLRARDPEPTNADLSDGIQMILRHLWPKEELEKLIDERHNALCSSCPYRPKESGGEDDTANGGQVAARLYEFALTVIKSPWFWIPVATACAILCAKYGISLPVVGGGN